MALKIFGFQLNHHHTDTDCKCQSSIDQALEDVKKSKASLLDKCKQVQTHLTDNTEPV